MQICRDSGIGMTKEKLIDCPGTIAQSGKQGPWCRQWFDRIQDFLVAEKIVVVSTKSPKSDKQYIWESVADSSSYVIREETDPENYLRRGIQITLKRSRLVRQPQKMRRPTTM